MNREELKKELDIREIKYPKNASDKILEKLLGEALEEEKHFDEEGNYVGPLGWYKLIKEIDSLDEEGNVTEKIPVDTILEVPVLTGNKWIKKGYAVLSSEEEMLGGEKEKLVEPEKPIEPTVKIDVDEDNGEYGAVSIIKDGSVIRVYSSKDHGENYLSIAKEYIKRDSKMTLKQFTAREVAEEIEEEKPHEVKILSSTNQVIRTFSEELHGEDYVSIAQQYFDKFGKDRKLKMIN